MTAINASPAAKTIPNPETRDPGDGTPPPGTLYATWSAIPGEIARLAKEARRGRGLVPHDLRRAHPPGRSRPPRGDRRGEPPTRIRGRRAGARASFDPRGDDERIHGRVADGRVGAHDLAQDGDRASSPPPRRGHQDARGRPLGSRHDLRERRAGRERLAEGVPGAPRGRNPVGESTEDRDGPRAQVLRPTHSAADRRDGRGRCDRSDRRRPVPRSPRRDRVGRCGPRDAGEAGIAGGVQGIADHLGLPAPAGGAGVPVVGVPAEALWDDRGVPPRPGDRIRPPTLDHRGFSRRSGRSGGRCWRISRERRP